MRKQIAAANWKMNLTLEGAQALLNDVLKEGLKPSADQQVIFAVPFPYLMLAKKSTRSRGTLSPPKIAAIKKAALYRRSFGGDASFDWY
jgi:triosephosphate isomerase